MSFLRYISSQNYIDFNFKFSYKKYIYSTALILLLFLITLPYVSYIILIILIFLIQIILVIILRNLYLLKLCTLYKKVLYFSLNTICLNYLINHNEYISISFSYIYFFYSLKIILLFYVKKFFLKFYIYYIVYQIPEYIKRFIVLNTLYMIIYYNISIFIKSEIVNTTLLIYYTKISNLKLNFYNIITINLLMSNQILEKNLENMNNLYLGIKIKSKTSKREIMKYIVFYNHKLFDRLLKDQNDLNIVLWIRSLHNKFKDTIYID
uniref:hypothetical protein orf264 n=1 Tax=Rhodomelopsis africana TaxID=1917047 RepID=UPI0022FD4E8A|nr:hypothetical protein orf264 [Rhodomelopsis africana]WAX02694.1 hypothetical protein orf264 [Rhodomelopsis africana]